MRLNDVIATNMKFFLIVFSLLYSLSIFGQREIPQATQDKMERMSLQFIDPVDTKFNILGPDRKRRDFLQHDFEIEKKDQLVLIKISPIENEQSLIQFPHLEFTRMLNHVASNDPESQIYIYDLPRDKGIDWMTEARFTPKKSLSEWEYGTVKSYFKEELGMISIIYLDKRIQARFEPYVGFIPEISTSNNLP